MSINTLKAFGHKGHLLQVTTFTSDAFKSDRLVQITDKFGDCLLDAYTLSDFKLGWQSILSDKVTFVRVLEALIPNTQGWLDHEKPKTFCSKYKMQIEAATDFVRIHRTRGLLSASERQAAI